MEIDFKMPLDCPSPSNDFPTLSDLHVIYKYNIYTCFFYIIWKDVFMDE
jgi:hypothetical protein